MNDKVTQVLAKYFHQLFNVELLPSYDNYLQLDRSQLRCQLPFILLLAYIKHFESLITSLQYYHYLVTMIKGSN